MVAERTCLHNHASKRFSYILIDMTATYQLRSGIFISKPISVTGQMDQNVKLQLIILAGDIFPIDCPHPIDAYTKVYGLSPNLVIAMIYLKKNLIQKIPEHKK